MRRDKKKWVQDEGVIGALRQIYKDKAGVLLPADIVDAARSLESPLHRFFEWDDTEAAEKYRQWQARQLLEVTVTVIKTTGSDVPMQVFCSLTTDRKEGGYRATVDVLNNDAWRNQLLKDALRDMEYFTMKYKQLQELSDVFLSMTRAASVLEKLAA